METTDWQSFFRIYIFKKQMQKFLKLIEEKKGKNKAELNKYMRNRARARANLDKIVLLIKTKL